MSSPLDPISGSIYFLGFFGGFPLVPLSDNPSDFDWDNCSSFKQNNFRLFWCFFVHTLVFIALCATVIGTALGDITPLDFFAFPQFFASGLNYTEVLIYFLEPVIFLVITYLYIHYLNQCEPELSKICYLSSRISDTFITDGEMRTVSTKTKRTLVLLNLANIILATPFGFVAIYYLYCDHMSVGLLVPFVCALKILYIFLLLSMPSVASFLISVQCIDVTRIMLKNYRSQILPQSKNGRLIRGKKGALPPPPYKSKDNSIPASRMSWQTNKSVVNNLVTVNDMDTLNELGNDLVDVAEHLDDAFGPLLSVDVFSSAILVLADFYVAVTSFMSAGFVGDANLEFLFAFGFYFFVMGILFIVRLNILATKCWKLEKELERTWTALREISILKFLRLTPQQLYELSALRDRVQHIMFDGAIAPNGYFRLSKGMLTNFYLIMMGYFLIVISFKMNQFNKPTMNCPVTNSTM